MVSNAIVINSNPILDQEWILQKIAHFHCNNKFEDFGWSQIRNVLDPTPLQAMDAVATNMGLDALALGAR